VGKFGVDIDDTIYPQEARLESAFSLDKGCYIGQEVVAKIDTYGGLNKRLMLLHVEHDNPIAPGTRLERFDEKRNTWRDLGVVTSWGYSFAIDGGCVLAYVKRRHQDEGTEFRLGEAPEGEDTRPKAHIVSLPRD
jgi:folate-binding protein YgfZ